VVIVLIPGTLQIDTTAPTVAAITTLPSTGNVTTGQVVTLSVAFSSAVTVAGGTPTLLLNDGGTATYVSGSGTGTLTFAYTVGAGQTTPDLALASSNAILLNGATIRDGAGNNAVLTGANGYNPAGTLQVGGSDVQSITVAGWDESIIPPSGTYVVSGTASGATITLGVGNQAVHLTGIDNVVTTGTGYDTITIAGDNNTVVTGGDASTIDATGNYEHITVGPAPNGTSVIDVAGFGQVVASTGTGNISLTGPTGSSTITLGNGNDTITLGGSSNTVTVGTGTSTINVGIGEGTVHAGGGADTITATGWNNLLDAGPGMNFLHGGSGNDTFVLNGSGQGLDTITGFQLTNHDLLDLTRTLASVASSVDLTNVGTYITATTAGGNTTLYVDPTGGHGTPYAFAVLDGVSATVAQLVAYNDLKVP
jgi:Ca2+-binding RTX toxin-like protein